MASSAPWRSTNSHDFLRQRVSGEIAEPAVGVAGVAESELTEPWPALLENEAENVQRVAPRRLDLLSALGGGGRLVFVLFPGNAWRRCHDSG